MNKLIIGDEVTIIPNERHTDRVKEFYGRRLSIDEIREIDGITYYGITEIAAYFPEEELKLVST